MSDVETTPTEDTSSAAPAPGQDGKDYTVDPAQLSPGQVIFEYGYIPTVFWGVDPESGQLEVGRFAGFDYGQAADFSTHRGPLPATALPDSAVSPNDRIAALESQVSTLLELLTKQGQGTAAAEATAPAPVETPAPTSAGTPFSVAPSGGAESSSPPSDAPVG